MTPVPTGGGLCAENLSFSYQRRSAGRAAVHDVSFCLPAGDFGVMLGVNGAGKSTLFALLTRLLVPATGGRIVLDGNDLARSPRQALARLGVVFQEATLDPDSTVEQNLRYAARLHGLSSAAMTEALDREMTRFALHERRRQTVRQLNGGHRRRVELARAMLHRPAVLLLDEPTVGLDPPSRSALLAHVRQLCAQDGVAALWATHLMDEAAAADSLYLLHQGRLSVQGRRQDLLADGQTVAELFATVSQEPASSL